MDSAYLAKQLASGHLKGIYVPTHKQEQFRSLFRRRNDLVKSLRRIKCHLKSMLLYYGIQLPLQYDNINWSKDFVQWLHKQHWSYAPATEAMKSRLSEYQFLKKEYLHICNELRAYARKQYKKEYYLLRSIPGVEPFTAIGLLAEVGAIKRFRGIDKLSSYIGLVPSVRSSGEKSYTCGITYRSKRLLRGYLIEAAWIAAKKDPALMQYYQERKGNDHKKLIIKLAAKTLSRIYHVIKTGEPYQLAMQFLEDRWVIQFKNLPRQCNFSLGPLRTEFMRFCFAFRGFCCRQLLFSRKQNKCGCPPCRTCMRQSIVPQKSRLCVQETRSTVPVRVFTWVTTPRFSQQRRECTGNAAAENLAAPAKQQLLIKAFSGMRWFYFAVPSVL